MPVYLGAGQGASCGSDEDIVSETANTSGKEGLDSVLAAIRKMVRKETRSRMAGGAIPEVEKPAVEKPAVEETGPEPEKRPVLLLQPHMRVDDKPEPEEPPVAPEVLEQAEDIPHAPPVEPSESFAIANPAVDEEMLREIVREVVQEQLRGEIGREIIRAMKLDLIRSLEKF